MVDSGDLKSPGRFGRVGSSPTPGTMKFRPIARSLRKAFSRYEPLIEIGISKKNLLHNLHTYQKRYPGLRFAPVLKSNAYGHGYCVIAELLDGEHIAFFAVDSLYEARKLRRGGIRSRIVVIGYVRPEYIARTSLRDTDYAIIDLEQLRGLATCATRPVRIHLKLDTGMHRQGILPADLPEAIRLVRSNPNLTVVGICSHFADADGPSPEHTDHQIETWNDALREAEAAFPDIEYRHIAATKGVPMSERTRANVARLGIGLYGFDTSHAGAEALKPVLEMRSLITSIREIPAGDFVGYNATWTAERPSRIATVPAGYFEGVDRGLSSKGSFLVRGTAAPIAGRVSMNMTSIDVTDIPEAKREDEVTVISRDSSQSNSVAQMAALTHTTPYVILAHIPEHLRRVVE